MQIHCTQDLQTGAVDDTHVDSQLAAVVVDDQDADGATTSLEGLGEAGPEVGLVDDWEGLLDVALFQVLVLLSPSV
jgi:hypothetical protein